MEITQVIVAYRNPFEMWLWESGAIWFMLPVFLFLFATLLYKAHSKPKFKSTRYPRTKD